MLKPVSTDIEALKTLEERLRWLSSWTIHHANHIRESSDGLKVGGHQASCASMTAIMAALYFHALGPERPRGGEAARGAGAARDPLPARLAIARPARELPRLRRRPVLSQPDQGQDPGRLLHRLGRARRGDHAFASLVQDYLTAHGWLDEQDRGRFIALIGDAELDEGNIYEAIIEGAKHDVRNLWWIVDYNRQSLDATTADRMFDRFDDIFRKLRLAGRSTLKYGKLPEAAFAEPGGEALQGLDRQASQRRLRGADLPGRRGLARAARGRHGAEGRRRFLEAATTTTRSQRLMTDLGGHCMETLVEAFDAADDDVPTLFIAYTIKGFGLPLPATRTITPGLMNPTQIAACARRWACARARSGSRSRESATMRGPAVEALLDRSAHRAREARRMRSAASPFPAIPAPAGDEQSTQAAFGRILLDLAKAGGDLADRIVTTSPDVTVSTNLGAWVNQRGLFRRSEMPDVFAKAKIASAQKWAGRQQGQHVELGIAESNLFLMLAAAGLSGDLFGERLFPIGTLYDPFIARGLDASITPATRTPASCWSRRRAGSRWAPKAARTSRSTRR